MILNLLRIYRGSYMPMIKWISLLFYKSIYFEFTDSDYLVWGFVSDKSSYFFFKTILPSLKNVIMI